MKTFECTSELTRKFIKRVFIEAENEEEARAKMSEIEWGYPSDDPASDWIYDEYKDIVSYTLPDEVD